MIEGMVKDGVIEPSSSPWCSPVVLVKKKDGSMRFCVDYRRPNDVTKKDSYPLPRIDDTLDMLTGVKWFSTLDLKSGYWQVESDPKDKEKTAFSTVSEEGIRTDPEKITAVKDWPVPKDKTQVRAFLGLCSYYRRFVKNFADIAKPLHRLTKEKRHFCWDESCDIAFQELKNRLCKTPILGYPDAGKEFIVNTDASDVGLGGVLS
ncbi:unnamed protein product [Parnassius mnemosyne]|uniref:RNA-directed DNA polymerase n=1 Tax=Parnassius mnemosyne TaxID=213953 RepID=A0AAV1L1G5_9NEOP